MTPYPYELEDLARSAGVDPLDALEFWLERSAIREECMSRTEADRLAMDDARVWLANKRQERTGAPPRDLLPTGSQGPGEPITSREGKS